MAPIVPRTQIAAYTCTIQTQMIATAADATTPVDPGVLEAMLPYLHEQFGNPSSAHALGRRARRHRASPDEVASLVGAFADEIVFTSGGTEASNIAIRGDVTMEPARRAVVTTNIEHPATEACSDLLERAGHPVSRVAAKADGCSNVPEVASIRLPWRRQPPMRQRL